MREGGGGGGAEANALAPAWTHRDNDACGAAPANDAACRRQRADAEGDGQEA